VTAKSPANEYHFVTHWQFEATADEVYAIIEDVESLEQWWSSVYLEVKVLEPGDGQGVGKAAFLFKPIFSANDRCAMARGEESMKLELGRRRRSERQPGPI
jgi:hypothetical protein